ALAELIMKLLAKKPADRPASAQEVLATLSAIERAWSTAGSTAPVASEPSRPVVGPPLATITPIPVLAQRRSPRRWAFPAAVLLGFLRISYAVYQLTFRTAHGTLIVEVDGDADVRFKNGKLQIFDETGKLKYELEPSEKNKELPPGKYLIKVTGPDGLKLDTD